MDKILAYIPAGSPKIIDGELKHHLILNDISVLENTINSALQSGLKITSTVRNSKQIKEKYQTHENIIILESRDKLVDSCIFGLMEGVINHFHQETFHGNWSSVHDIKKYLKKHPSLLDLKLIYLGSDSPFMSAQEISNFIDRYNSLSTEPDIFVGMSNMHKLFEMDANLNLHLRELDSTIDNYCITDQGIFRPSNMYIIKPFKLIKEGFSGPLQKLYDHRKLSQGLTPYLGVVSGIFSLIYKGLKHDPKTTITFLRDIYFLSSHLKGKNKNHSVDINKAESVASTFLDIKVTIDTKGALGSLLDIDDEGSYHCFKNNYQIITEYLKRDNLSSRI